MMNDRQHSALEIEPEKSLSFTEAQPIQQEENTSSSKIEYAVSTKWEAEQRSHMIANQNQEQQQRPIRKITTVDICSSIFCFCSRRVGSMFFICESKKGKPLVVAGPCWPFCTFVTLPLIVGLSGLALYFCFLKDDSPLPPWMIYVYIPLIAITLIALFMVSCQDPGLMERRTTEDRESNAFLWNEQVGSYRPPDALYCRECQVLIEDYDHLCPWTGTGIGKKNMRAFKLFVVFVNVLCYATIAIVVYVLMKG